MVNVGKYTSPMDPMGYKYLEDGLPGIVSGWDHPHLSAMNQPFIPRPTRSLGDEADHHGYKPRILNGMILQVVGWARPQNRAERTVISTGMSREVIVTIVSKFVYNLFTGRNQPTYIGVRIHLLTSMDTLGCYKGHL